MARTQVSLGGFSARPDDSCGHPQVRRTSVMNDSFTTLTPPVSKRDHVQGSPSAPVTLVEYGDFQCPFCGDTYPIIKRLQKHFGEQLRFVFRHFPRVKIHAFAQRAAE